MQQIYSSTYSRPIAIDQSTEAKVYGLFALAMALTAGGTFLGIQFAEVLLTSGVLIFFVIAELGLILTSRLWMNQTPLNYLLFALFPTLSGITVTPYLMSILVNYANGGAILLNALSATAFMGVAAAFFARTTSWNLGFMGRGLFFAVLGLIAMGLLQIFVPSLRSGMFELVLSGGGVVIFGLFTAYDLQRIQKMGQVGANPFMLALSLYLDIFNLFLYILRFMVSMSGERQ